MTKNSLPHGGLQTFHQNSTASSTCPDAGDFNVLSGRKMTPRIRGEQNMELYGVIWSYMELYGVIWSHMELYGVIWSHMELFVILWSNMELY